MSIELINGDCLIEMKKMPDKSIDLILTDPPYGVGKAKWDENMYWDNLLREFGLDIVPKLKDDAIVIVFSSTRYLDKTMEYIQVKYRWQFIWYSSNNMQHSDIGFQKYTPALIFSNRKSIFNNVQDLRDYPSGTNELKNSGHPTPKPLALIRYLTDKFSHKGDLVLDPFMGSGTTGVACAELDRNFIGIEIDEGYFNIAKKRIEQAKSQGHFNF